MHDNILLLVLFFLTIVSFKFYLLNVFLLMLYLSYRMSYTDKALGSISNTKIIQSKNCIFLIGLKSLFSKTNHIQSITKISLILVVKPKYKSIQGDFLVFFSFSRISCFLSLFPLFFSVQNSTTKILKKKSYHQIFMN